MGAGTGGDRPYTPKEPDPDELNTESLFNEFKNLQRRNKWLKGVRLELNPETPEGGESAHFDPYGDTPTMRLFLPNLRRGYEVIKGRERIAGHPYQRRDFTKHVRAVLRHEAAHAWQMEQNRIRGIDSFSDEPTKKAPPGRRAYIETSQHGEIFNLLNRMLGGVGAEPLLPSIGLPHELARARWQQSLRKTGPGAEMMLPVLGGKG